MTHCDLDVQGTDKVPPPPPASAFNCFIALDDVYFSLIYNCMERGTGFLAYLPHCQKLRTVCIGSDLNLVVVVPALHNELYYERRVIYPVYHLMDDNSVLCRELISLGRWVRLPTKKQLAASSTMSIDLAPTPPPVRRPPPFVSITTTAASKKKKKKKPRRKKSTLPFNDEESNP